MIIKRLGLAFCCLVLANAAVAQIDPDPDGLGIYFDEAATQVTASAAIDEYVDAYIIVTNPSQVGYLAFWQVYVGASVQAVQIWGGARHGANMVTNMPPGGPGFGFAVFTAPEFHPTSPIMVLGTLSIGVFTDEPIGLHLYGPEGGLPYYGVGAIGEGTEQVLYPSSGSMDLPVAVINGEAPVSAEPQTWGGIKSLYR